MAQKTGTARSQRKEATREQILTAATKMLAEHGYAALRVAAVAKQAGVSLGGQLHHFPSKESLVIAVIERLAGQILEVAKRDAARDTGDADILQLIADSAQRYYATPEFLVFLDIFLSVRRHTLVGDTAMMHAVAHRAETEALWRPHLTARGVSKEEATLIARVLWSLARGLAISSSPSRGKVGNTAAMSFVIDALRKTYFGAQRRRAAGSEQQTSGSDRAAGAARLP